MCLLCFHFVNGQNRSGQPRPVRIGEQIPPALWEMPLKVVNGPSDKKMLTLNAYKGKLIILNFWATSCGSCIAHMPSNMDLASQFKDDLFYLQVTRQAEGKILDFMSTNKYIRGIKPMSVVEDTVLMRFFPHKLLPHYVWITPDGKLYATTEHGSFNSGDIKKMIERKGIDYTAKIDQDVTRPLYLSNEMPANIKAVQYGILIKGRINGIATVKTVREKDGHRSGVLYANQMLFKIYLDLGKSLIPGFNRKMMIWEVDAFNLNNKPHSSLTDEDCYSFDFNRNSFTDQDVLEQLNIATGFSGKIEKKEVDCYLMTKIGKLDALISKGGKSSNSLFEKSESFLRNNTLRALVNRLNDSDMPYPLVIDETGFSQKVDMVLKADPKDHMALRNELKQYGLDLIPSKREINVLIVSKK